MKIKGTEFLKPIHLACSNDDLRPVLSLIEIKDNIATATNAHIMIRVNLAKTTELTEDTLKILNGKYIHKNVWKEIWRCDKLEFTETNIICHKQDVKYTFDYSQPTMSFANVEGLVQIIEEAGVQTREMICYNYAFIKTIQNIFKTPLVFKFYGKEKGTIVFSENNVNMYAVLMHINQNGNEEQYNIKLF